MYFFAWISDEVFCRSESDSESESYEESECECQKNSYEKILLSHSSDAPNLFFIIAIVLLLVLRDRLQKGDWNPFLSSLSSYSVSETQST